MREGVSDHNRHRDILLVGGCGLIFAIGAVMGWFYFDYKIVSLTHLSQDAGETTAFWDERGMRLGVEFPEKFTYLVTDEPGGPLLLEIRGRDLVVGKDYAYTLEPEGETYFLNIYELASLAEATTTAARINLSSRFPSCCENLRVSEDKNFLIIDLYAPYYGLVFFRLENQREPELWATLNGSELGGRVLDLIVRDDLMYFLSYKSDGQKRSLGIFDIARKRGPRVISHTEFNFPLLATLRLAGKYLYVLGRGSVGAVGVYDDKPLRAGVRERDAQIFDVSDPSAPQEVGDLPIFGDDLVVVGNTALVFTDEEVSTFTLEGERIAYREGTVTLPYFEYQYHSSHEHMLVPIDRGHIVVMGFDTAAVVAVRNPQEVTVPRVYNPPRGLLERVHVTDNKLLIKVFFEEDYYSGYFFYTLPYSQSRQVGQSLALNAGKGRVARVTLFAKADVPPDTHAEYFVSNDGGKTWEKTELGTRHTFTRKGNDLRVKVELSSEDPLMTPRITDLEVTYR